MFDFASIVTTIIIAAIIGVLSAIIASKLLKANNGPIQWLIIGTVGTVFGVLISWVLIQTGVAEFALTMVSTIMGSCIFILLDRFMRKNDSK